MYECLYVDKKFLMEYLLKLSSISFTVIAPNMPGIPFTDLFRTLLALHRHFY